MKKHYWFMEHNNKHWHTDKEPQRKDYVYYEDDLTKDEAEEITREMRKLERRLA